MRWHIVLFDWAGPVPFGEQQLALRNIACLYLRHGYDTRVNFTHALVEGKLIHRGPTSIGAFAGHRFFADLGTHNELPWYCEFLLPSSHRLEDVDEDSAIIAAIPDDDKYVFHDVDVDLGRATRDNILSG